MRDDLSEQSDNTEHPLYGGEEGEDVGAGSNQNPHSQSPQLHQASIGASGPDEQILAGGMETGQKRSSGHDTMAHEMTFSPQ